MNVPAAAAGKKVRCPQCQAVVQVPATQAPVTQAPAPQAPGTAAAPASMSVSCPGCQKGLKLPAGAAGKTVRCPSCQSAFQVPFASPAAAAAAAMPSPQPQAAAAHRAPALAAAPAAGGLGDLGNFDDLLSDGDFNTTTVAAPPPKPKDDIPVGSGLPKKRNPAFYFLPGLFAIIAASLNILVFVGLLVIAILAVLAVGALAIPLLIFIGFWAVMNISSNAHAIVGGLNVMNRVARSSAGITIGELLFAPLVLDGVFIWNAVELGGEDGSWILPIIVGAVFAAYNWPPAIWLIVILSGKQAKVDFDEYDDGELDELAEELIKRSNAKKASH